MTLANVLPFDDTGQYQHAESRVYVIVLNWNAAKLTLSCLRRSKNRLMGPSKSSWSTMIDGWFLRLIASSFPDVTLICNPVNVGFAEGSNQGIRHALKETCYVLMLNK